MLKVLRAVGDEFEIEDLDEGGVGLVSAETLVLLLAKNEFEGCKHSRNGIEVWYDGVEPYEIAIEVWKPISVYNCKTQDGVWKYWVSNLGRVALKRYIDEVGRFHDARELGYRFNKQGYRNVALRVCNVQKSFRVCRLVATAFVFNKDNHPIVNHKNESKCEDWCGNLEWCTYLYNNTYNGIQFRRAEKFKKCVRQYSMSGVLIKEFESLSDACASLNICVTTNISSCCRRDKGYSYANGFVWRFVDDDELYDLAESDRRQLISCICKYIRQYNLDGKFVCEYRSAVSASCSTGADQTSIRSVCKRRKSYNSAGGFIWRYVYDDEFADRPENAKAIEEWRARQNAKS